MNIRGKHLLKTALIERNRYWFNWIESNAETKDYYSNVLNPGIFLLSLVLIFTINTDTKSRNGLNSLPFSIHIWFLSRQKLSYKYCKIPSVLIISSKNLQRKGDIWKNNRHGGQPERPNNHENNTVLSTLNDVSTFVENEAKQDKFESMQKRKQELNCQMVGFEVTITYHDDEQARLNIKLGELAKWYVFSF